jgi:hypothetical protein
MNPNRGPTVTLGDPHGIDVVCDEFEGNASDIADQISVSYAFGWLFLHTALVA